MIKGQRPSNHVRIVNTKRGRKAVRVNPMINKQTTNKQYKKAMKKLAPFADADGDGKKNIDDCRPFDKKKQDEDYLKDITKYKFGTVEWQDAMQYNINQKRIHGDSLDDFERSFEPVQREHTDKRITSDFQVINDKMREGIIRQQMTQRRTDLQKEYARLSIDDPRRREIRREIDRLDMEESRLEWQGR